MRGIAVFIVLALLMAGCASPAKEESVREIQLHIGYSPDRTAQYVEPKEVRAKLGERIRFVVTNDDKAGARDSFHDVALKYPGYGTIEHEVPAGKTARTCVPQAEPDHACPEGKGFIELKEKGRFKLYCEVGPLGRTNPDGSPQTRHEQMGMWGTLIVQ